MNQASCDLLFRVLRTASRFEIRQRKRSFRSPAYIVWWGIGIQIGLYAFALAVGLSRPVLGAPAWFVYIAAYALLLSYIAALATPLVAVLFTVRLYWRQIKEVIKNPIVIPLWHAGIKANVDANFLSIIMRRPLEDIEFVLLEVKAEREFFEQRVSLIVGVIEKIGVIGIVPGLLAALKWV
jgi:hypothetical protein